VLSLSISECCHRIPTASEQRGNTLERVEALSPESRGLHLDLTVSFVPYSIDSGPGPVVRGNSGLSIEVNVLETCESSQSKSNFLAEMYSGSEVGLYSRLIDVVSLSSRPESNEEGDEKDVDEDF